MKAIVQPGRLAGEMQAIPSKSQAHRLLIAAALAQGETRIFCPEVSDDIKRTAACLQSLCADISYAAGVFTVRPRAPEKAAVLDCGESGSTYRFLMPVCAALGGRFTFLLRGRLPHRPMDALFEVLEAQRISVSGKGSPEVSIEGRLCGPRFEVAGNVSSQFISGLLLAAPLLDSGAEIILTTPLSSSAYVEITMEALRRFGISAARQGDAFIVEEGSYRAAGEVQVEGDWSGAAFFLCAAAAGKSNVRMTGLDLHSTQGDRRILDFLRAFGAEVSEEEGAVTVRGDELGGTVIDIDETPDLAPCLVLLGLAARGETRLVNIARLRAKESDRAAAITQTLQALGADILLEKDAIIIRGKAPLTGGVCSAQGDHRIAMMAACAAAVSKGPVSITGAQAVSKSYPRFFEHLEALGLNVYMEED